ncbi:hypothetical protein HID58_075727, partial [Brassica napus]
TKNVISLVQSLASELGYWNVKIVPAFGSSGVAMFWSDRVKISFLNDHTLYCTNMCVEDGTNTFWLTYIYGNPVIKYIQKQWCDKIEFEYAGFLQNKPRLMIGDFNDIKGGEEKQGGIIRSVASYSLFRRMLSTLGMNDIKSVGGKYTWLRSYSGLDQTIDPYFSIQKEIIGRNLNFSDMIADEDFTLACAQESANLSNGDIHYLIRQCRKVLSRWRSKQSTNSGKLIQELKDKIHLFHHEDVQRIMRLRPSITGSEDRLYWRYNKTGSYTVKSGYHLQKQIDTEQENSPTTTRFLRNKLLFQNKREHITHVISASIMDKNLWDEAHQFNELPQLLPPSACPTSIVDIIGEETMLYCIADASWKSTIVLSGIGWFLYSREGTLLIQGSSAITPTDSALQAEAMAILLAVQQLHALSYKNIMFLGDCAQLFKSLDIPSQRGNKRLIFNEASIIMIQDVLILARLNNFIFKHVPRNYVHHVDQLAKKARIMSQ